MVFAATMDVKAARPAAMQEIPSELAAPQEEALEVATESIIHAQISFDGSRFVRDNVLSEPRIGITLTVVVGAAFVTYKIPLAVVLVLVFPDINRIRGK